MVFTTNNIMYSKIDFIIQLETRLAVTTINQILFVVVITVVLYCVVLYQILLYF